MAEGVGTVKQPDKGPQPCTTEWVQQQVAEFAKRREGYLLMEKVLKEVLDCAAAEYAPLAIVTARAKGIPSFAEKSLRKCHKYNDPVDRMTDLCGARVIVHTQEQVERISRFLEEHFEIDWDNSEDIGKRLKATEFGYRSVHYIVTFKRGVFPTSDCPVRVPARLYGGTRGIRNPRAEVQVRTLMQHAWADVGHDLLYKGGFKAPEVWEREYARLAAMLETADGVFGRVHGGMRRFLSSYKAYMTAEQMKAELELLETLRQHDPGNISLALRIGGIANAAERWDSAIAALEPHAAGDERRGARDPSARPDEPVVLRELGVAYCGKGRSGPRGALYKRGQGLLEQSAKDPDAGAPALLCLAASWRGVDTKRARAAFARAVEALPDDPHALAGHLEYEIAARRDLGPMTAARATVASAVETCDSRVRAGVDVPGAYFTAGFLQLLLGKPYEALDAYAKGVQLAGGERPLAVALDSLRRIDSVSGSLEGHAWVVRLLLLGRAVLPSAPKSALAAAQALATPGLKRPAEPVVMVAGGCDPDKAEQFERYREVVVRGFADFSGTVIGGGTREGVSGFVGEACQGNPAMTAISYLPRPLSRNATRDRRYSELRPIRDTGFTPMGPLQAWTDLIASGIEPAGVRLLGINGGRISAAEYRIALALGASVALVEDSGREAAKLLPDEQWGLSKRLVRMPADWASVRSFVGPAPVEMPEWLKEAVARGFHEEHAKARANQDPAAADWEQLIPEFRRSSLLSAADVFAKLKLVGLEAVPVGEPGEPVEVIPVEQVEYLAEIEHGRWNAERLLDGWRRGAARDPKARTSPYLVRWAELPDDVREHDRNFVRRIPTILAEHGYKVRKKGF